MAKRSTKIEPLDIDEMFNSPSLDGMLSFRDVQPATAVEMLRARATLDAAESAAASTVAQDTSSPLIEPEKPEPIGFMPIGVAAVKELPTDFSPEKTAKKRTPPPGLSEADILAEFQGAPRPPVTRGRLIPALKMEDGHSNNENALYWYLWRSGRQIKNSKSRFLQAGYAQLSKAIEVDRTNVQNMLRSLESKLSIRIVTPGTVRSATVYEVYSCEQILVRRGELGLRWVRRFGSRRADFVQESGEALPPIGSALPTSSASAPPTFGTQTAEA